MKHISTKKRTIFRKILVPLILIMTLQLCIVYGVIYIGGTVREMQNNCLDILVEKTNSRANLLEIEMVQRWSRLDGTAVTITETVEKWLGERGLTDAALTQNSSASTELLGKLSDTVIAMVRKNTVTGGFLVFEGDDKDNKDGVYFRDTNPQNNPEDYSDILTLRGSSKITKSLGVALDTYWTPTFDFTESDESTTAFYHNPVNAALQSPEIYTTDCGYWSSLFHVSGEETDVPVITYSIPLRLSNGALLGVLGVEIDYDYFSEFLPNRELGHTGSEGYLLLKENSEGEKTVQVLTGTLFKSRIEKGETVEFETDLLDSNRVYLRSEDLNLDALLHYIPLNLYNTNTPFAHEKWIIVATIEENVLFSAANRFQLLLFYSAIGAGVIGIIGIFLATRLITNPISSLSAKLKNASPKQIVSLGKVGVAEIDDLIVSLEYYSGRAADSAARLSQILDMTGITVGAFSLDSKDAEYVQCTEGVFELIPFLKEYGGENGDVPFYQFVSYGLDRFLKSGREGELVIVDSEIDVGVDEHRWIRSQLKRTGEKTLGVFTDVTKEILEKKRIEHDRDYDVLTNLYNRRAFWNNANRLSVNPMKMGISAALMVDLDNLKFVNDTYGHDYGDLYIKTTGKVLAGVCNDNCIAARISGDEFVVLFHGFLDRRQIHILCDKLQETMRQTMIAMPDGTFIQLRASAGLAWYPDDSKSLEQLVEFADFAMYMVKRDRKGELSEFNLEIYNRNAYLLHCMEELNTLIDQELVDYQFQPIVDVRTGAIFAYEALMRPRSENIKSPLELLALAKSQFRLSALERLTFYRAMESFAGQPAINSNAKLFINSIANQVMTDDEIHIFAEKFKPLLSRIVIEITESEQTHEDYTPKKLSTARAWGAEIAVDDYGTGYNGEVSILSLSPRYIKIDISLVRDIDTNYDKQQIIGNLILYSYNRNIKLIAEGVENRSELKTLVSMGIDYVQGYFLARPSYGAIPALSDEKLAELVEINAECEQAQALDTLKK